MVFNFENKEFSPSPVVFWEGGEVGWLEGVVVDVSLWPAGSGVGWVGC